MKITGFKCWVEGIWNVNLVPRNLRHIWEFSFGKFSGFFSTSFQQQQQQQRGWGRGFPQPDSPRCPMASPPSNEYQWNKSTISKSFVCPSTRRRHFGIWASTTRIDFKWIIIKPMKNELNLAGEGRKDEEGAALPALIEHRRLSNDDLQGRRAGGGARPKSQASDGYPGRHVIKCRLVIGSEKRRACWQQLPNFLSVSLILSLLLCESLFHFRVFFSRILPDSSRFFQILPDSSRFFGMLGLSLPPCPVIDFLFFGFSFSYFSAIFLSFSLSFFQILEIFDWLIDLYRLIRIVGDAGPLGGMLSSHWSSQIAVVRNVAARWPVPFSLEAWWMLLGNWSPQRFSEFFDWIFNIQQNGGGFFRSAGDQWDIDDCNDLIVLKRTISMEKKAIDWGLRIHSGSATGRERLRKPLNPPGRFREEGPAEARSTGPHGAAPERFGIGGERGYAIKGGEAVAEPSHPLQVNFFSRIPLAFRCGTWPTVSLRILSGCSADAADHWDHLRFLSLFGDSLEFSFDSPTFFWLIRIASRFFG